MFIYLFIYITGNKRLFDYILNRVINTFNQCLEYIYKKKESIDTIKYYNAYINIYIRNCPAHPPETITLKYYQRSVGSLL